jgi:putative ABC transport system permease protein
LLLTLGSGVLVMFFAAALMSLGSNVQGPGGFDPPKLVPMSAVLAIGSLTLAGVIAGLYPARKAAMLQPVEALRQE